MREITLLCILAAAVTIGPAHAQYYDDESQECLDAQGDAEDAADDLASYSGQLQQCAENEDYSDDCSSEFYSVQNAHSEYESASSEVSYACD